MTKLRNGKHERFATGLADGFSQEKSYIEAGFSPNGARGAACNLIKQYSYIIKRRDEILAERETLHSVSTVEAMKELQLTKKDVMKELLDNAMRAKAAVPVLKNGEPIGVYQANISASNQALMLLGKELGMFTDRTDVNVSTHSNMSDRDLRAFVVEKYKKLGLDLDAKVIEAEVITPEE